MAFGHPFFYHIFINKKFMKKIVLTESQLNMVKSHINEESGMNRYNTKVSVDIDKYNATFNGLRIDDANIEDMSVSFSIDMSHKSWGIKDIGVYNITGPSEIDLYVTPQDDEGNEREEIVSLQLNWENIETEEEHNGLITVGDSITIELGNDEQGNIIVSKMTVPVYTI